MAEKRVHLIAAVMAHEATTACGRWVRVQREFDPRPTAEVRVWSAKGGRTNIDVTLDAEMTTCARCVSRMPEVLGATRFAENIKDWN